MQPVEDVLKKATEQHLAGNWPEAEAMYCKIIAHTDHPMAHFCMGTLYAQAMAPGRAITFLRRAIDLAPENHEAMANLAGVYRQIERRDDAIHWLERSIAIESNAGKLSNLAGCYINQGEPETALKYADMALALRPGFPEAGNHRALALLEMGRFKEGWEQYEARRQCLGSNDPKMLTRARFYPRPFTAPYWTGKRVRRLAIHGEQGLGDEIMFLTCLAQLRHRFDEVAIEVNPRLVKLIQNSLPFAKVYGSHDERPWEPDAHIAMGSLPRLCWPVKPNAYLRPTTTMPKRHRLGLSWYGGSMLTHDALRNTLVEHWKPLLVENTVSLQYGPHEEEAAALGIPHDSLLISDLDRLASLIKSCDLVVSVCNTTIHMAGALGVPCLCLVPSKPAWRYGLTGEKMVWYDSVRMIRQEKDEPWTSVIERARRAMSDYGVVPGAEQAAA